MTEPVVKNPEEPDMVVDVSNDVLTAAAHGERVAEADAAQKVIDDAAAAQKVIDDATAAAKAENDPGFVATNIPAVPAVELDSEGRPVAKKQTADERIAELVKRAKDAEDVAFKAEMKLIEREKADKAAEPKPPAALTMPDAKDFVYGEVDTEYLDAVVEFKVSARLAKDREEFVASQKTATDQETQAKYRVKVTDTMAAGAKQHEDFEAVVSAAQFDGHLARLVVDSEGAVDIAYHLANNGDELLKVTRANPEDRARIIGRLEGKFSATSAARKQTNAPKEIGKGQEKPTGETDAQYGPSNQDDFDKALLGG